MRKTLSFLLSFLGLNFTMGCTSAPSFDTLSTNAFSDYISKNDIQLVDVRSSEEYAEGHIEGAINIDVQKEHFMEDALSRLDKQRPVAVYCKSGRRSVSAAKKLVKEGFTVVNLQGGIMGWRLLRKPVVKGNDPLDLFPTPGGHQVGFQALLHASLRISYAGKEIEVDPVRQLGERKTDYSQFPQADYILVTHEHGDHFDKEAIKTLSKEGTQLVTNQRCSEMMGYGTVMANGDDLMLGDIKVEAIPAYNTTEGRLQFHPQGRDNGYILTIDGLRVYIAGDTEDIPEMDNLGAIDIAFLPCNQPYTMTTTQLVNAAKRIKPRVLFPYHFGKTDLSGIPEALKDTGIEVRIKSEFE